MTILKTIEYIDNFIANYINNYKLTDDSKDANGDYITHPLELKDTASKLMAIDYGLKDTALNTIPLTLLENTGSNATEYKKISTEEFIRLPQAPVEDGNLDIDEALSFAVIYKALSFLDEDFAIYSSDAETLYANHNDVTRDYLMERDAGTAEAQAVYFRYSSDGVEYHDNFIDGDTYISFKQGDGVWSVAIKFVGEGTAGGGGASTFIELTDTPNTLTAGKYLKVNDTGDALEETDAPSGYTPLYDVTGGDGVQGDIYIDWRASSANNNFHYFVLGGDMVLHLTQTDGANDIEMGRVYTLEIFPEGFNCTFDFTIKGDATIDPTSYATIIQFLFDGLDIFVLNNTVISN